MRIRNLVVSAALLIALALPTSSYAVWDDPDNPCPPGVLCADEEPAPAEEPAEEAPKEEKKEEEKKESSNVSVGLWIPKITAPKECPTCWGGSITIRF